MQKIAEVVKRILSRRSSISISWLFATFVVGGAFNYLYHLVTGRLLGPARYSVVATFIAFQLAIMAPLNVLIPIFSDLTTRNIESETQGKIKSVFRYVSLGLWAVGIISLGMMLVFSDVLERWIGISGVPVILMFGVFVMLNMHFPAASGILQGWKDFRAMGFLRLFSGFNRLVFTLVLLGAGLGLDGALGGNELTDRVLAALILYDQEHPMWKDQKIVSAVQAFNVTHADWVLIVDLFHKANAVFREQGRSIHKVYDAWRMNMSAEKS